MERCLDCNSLLTKEEKVCFECGSKVGGSNEGAGDFLVSLVSIMFYLSFAVTIASPFISKGPSFMLCLLITGALLFVMRTAKDTGPVHKKR